MTNAPSDPLAGIDPTKPSIARGYDAFLGGKDNFEADRRIVTLMKHILPEEPNIAVQNRQWLIRVVRFLTGEAKINQFLDIGAGLPTAENTHQAAQRVIPNARVLYVDNDPVCLAHGHALLEDNEYTRFLDADLTRPHELLSHPLVTGHLDFTEPLGLIQCGTLHHVSDDLRPHDIMAAYIDALPSGSYLALTHFWDPKEDAELTATVREIKTALREKGLYSAYWRTREEIHGFFDGLEMVEPGLVPLYQWWPEGPRLRELNRTDHLILGGVGRKP